MNFREAIDRFGIEFPDTLDNDGRRGEHLNSVSDRLTYLIDQNSHIRYKQIGEFNLTSASEVVDVIEALLLESGLEPE